MTQTRGEKIFSIFNYCFMILIGVIMLFPVWHVIMYSISDANKTMGVGLFLKPSGFSLQAYKIVLRDSTIIRAYANTILVTIVATVINIIMSFLIAYPLSRNDFSGKKPITFLLFFTMLFSGGLIPTYLVMRSLGLLNSLWALIIPGMISPYNVFVLRNFIKTIPISLAESARIDGANEFVILIKIIIPLSKPVIAVLLLMYGIGHWNSWFNCIIYITDRSKFTLQPILRELLFVMNSVEFFKNDVDLNVGQSQMPEVVKMATVVVATLPTMLVYPFLQKYFIKGAMIGAIKG